ncbi:protein-glutamine gamma-glutamyltransferase [Halobacillus karajensis]|uniref:Protein-glutamine gamma-glutamyltransferase n=1 Tax=Halobacillus karajensis TaxID=195088 RepID=A0A024P8S9_9BACI|nr:protein-glutamine gamma-glutamyltransferase [Halobacillus karajensis]CDQ20196.1 Protein-glutamine gamma-glutamyltransferase [Halobacillus karajensis]CDQ25141.1 Protein-glutamine gamma-glutamyltransferase [Halobacillus karajensis]CDQ28498.1 Protein-glutamine gamma-glutamyltransferase [Halobacillus karajensis]SEI01833.1 protein-glutamine gamma-glutamyltransferase [Halobacillus karajensis]
MIQVSGRPYQPADSWKTNKIENVIIESLQKVQDIYPFSSEQELLFEIKARRNIIESAKEMNDGESTFATFRKARCNEEYWNLTRAGGFLLRLQVRPADAILDIFKNSALYRFECATACVINFYHGLLQTMGNDSFNTLFPNLYLYSWHADDDLGLQSSFKNHYIPGDVVYFNNPDVNPQTPWFRGVNAIAMGDNQFFGHGFSIRTEEKMIAALNTKRKPEQPQSAYLTSLITKPSFNRLARFSTISGGRTIHKTTPFLVHHNKTSVSYRHYWYELSYKRRH